VKRLITIYADKKPVNTWGHSSDLIDVLADGVTSGYPFYEILFGDGNKLYVRPYRFHKETDAEEEAREKWEAGLP